MGPPRRPFKETALSFAPPSARYLQVKHFVLEQVAAGTLRAGERVPSENELVRELRVSRMTANRALKELAADGVLVRVAGVGTFVAEQRVHAHPLEVRNIADEIRARGHEYRVRVVALQPVTATRELAERFELKTGAALDYSLLTHFEGGVPLQVEERYVNPQAAPGLPALTTSASITPHEFLDQGGAAAARRAHRARAHARAAHPPPAEARGRRGLPADHAPHLLQGPHRQRGGSLPSRFALRTRPRTIQPR